MEIRPPEKDAAPVRLVARLDRAAGEVNVFLLVFAIGLIVLDLTCLFAFSVRDALPAAGAPSHAARTAAVKPTQPTGQAMVALAPSKPSASITGW